ncbi:metal-dependent amidase [Ameyamaea chiangmaiensis NBRC 103196]|uniref:Amidohydrolase n=1 Tax=Ameyamaea chiangmaiensis TaxID=442969 RepID=A0A850PDA4_9PROT|nr:M20 aminoacylase family protein [Ameyamaea chiangmaiensis]MBS4075693.1 amidohydrolase [Ameyamaea chiangmaiensis]NVN40266.1 amidohydrolase [Ameyamaea chiangmaiensis]GBQ70489.1 metal-dependent amidase [Ameyamaea chiangmaiensis NBRC 103196]
MSAFDFMTRHRAEFDAIRHDLHAHPELGLEEHRTAGIVADKLTEWGIEVHRGIGRTGVVGVLRSGNGAGSIGLRADMDALPMQEDNTVSYRSTKPGLMHACGHDGHTTMLLAAARYLAETRSFDGTVNFIFQPGEEGVGGALAMLEDGLLERFPCDALFGMHNRPGLPVGQFAIRPGAAMAGGAFFDITIKGKGAHGARPEDSIDPVLVAGHLITALQTIVSRNLPHSDVAVLSITKMTGGDAYNIIPDTATLGGTVRCFDSAIMTRIRDLLERTATNIAEGFGARASLDFRLIFAPTVNDPVHTTAYADTAAELVGEANVDRHAEAVMGSEDFSFMLEKTPGAYILAGGGQGAAPHHPRYNFNDETTPYGAALYARLVERSLPRMAHD